MGSIPEKTWKIVSRWFDLKCRFFLTGNVWENQRGPKISRYNVYLKFAQWNYLVFMSTFDNQSMSTIGCVGKLGHLFGFLRHYLLTAQWYFIGFQWFAIELNYWTFWNKNGVIWFWFHDQLKAHRLHPHIPTDYRHTDRHIRLHGNNSYCSLLHSAKPSP